MTILFYQIINSLGESIRYALLALGYTLFFGILDVIIFCVADIVIVSMYIMLSIFGLFTVMGLYEILPTYLCVIITVGTGCLLTGILAY